MSTGLAAGVLRGWNPWFPLPKGLGAGTKGSEGGGAGLTLATPLCPRLARRSATQPLLALLHTLLLTVLPQPLASAPVLRGRCEIRTQPLLLPQETG